MAITQLTAEWRVRATTVRALVFGVALMASPMGVAAQTGVVSGTVTQAATGAPVSGGQVVICPPDGNCTFHNVSTIGTYAATLPVGRYVAYTDTTGPLVDAIFNDIPCPVSCDSSSANRLGTPIVVTAGATLGGRNFALHPVSTITGRVTDAATGAPLAGVIVAVDTTFGGRTQFGSATSAASGVFSVRNMGPGTYYGFTVSALPASTHTNEIFGDLLCLGPCDRRIAEDSGAPIVVSAGATTSGIDFALAPGGTISGRVTNSASSAAVAGARISVFTRAGGGLTSARSVDTDASGTYMVAGLVPGAYVVVALSNVGLISEVHDNRPCLASCTDDEIGAGTTVPVAAGTTSTINFALDRGGSISGTIVAAGSLTPLAGAVAVFRRVGSRFLQAGIAASTSSGTFVVSGLSTGSYFAVAITDGPPVIFDGLPCLPCSDAQIAAGTPITVTNGSNTPGINFLMPRTGSISGTVRAAPTNAPVAEGSVLVFRRGLASVFTVVGTSTTGGYTLSGLSAGTYFVATGTNQFTNQVFGGVTCPNTGCTASLATSQGTPITVAAGAAVTGFDFSLAPPSGPPSAPLDLRVDQSPGGVQFAWTAPSRGGVVTGYVLEAGLAPGTTFATLPVATTALTVPGVPPGTYFIRVRATSAAGIGSASRELTLRVGSSSVVVPEPPENLNSFIVGGRLTITWSPPDEGPAPAGYIIEAGSATGLSNIASIPVAVRSFVFDGVPPGFYFLRVRALSAGGTSAPTEEHLVLAGTTAAPPSAPFTQTLTVAGGVVTFTWSPPAVGPVTSYVVEAGSAPGLSNLAVLNTGSTATTLVIPGVPPGTYYVRLRAVNAFGAGPADSELTLVVP